MGREGGGGKWGPAGARRTAKSTGDDWEGVPANEGARHTGPWRRPAVSQLVPLGSNRMRSLESSRRFYGLRDRPPTQDLEDLQEVSMTWVLRYDGRWVLTPPSYEVEFKSTP